MGHLPPATPHDDPTHPGCPANWVKCRGCLPIPRPANRGRLCTPCATGTTKALLDLPHLVGHVRDHVRPGTWNPRHDVLREAPAPLSVAAVDDADELFATAYGWARDYATSHGLSGPDIPRAAVRWATGDVPVGLLPTRAPNVASTVTSVTYWLIAQGDGLAAWDRAGDYVTAVVDTHARISSRWPREPEARRLPLPCPSCNRLMLHMHPPAEQGHPVTIICETRTCGRVFTEDDYYWQVNAITERSLS